LGVTYITELGFQIYHHFLALVVVAWRSGCLAALVIDLRVLVSRF
jgi:hypothetical protein